ncbi:hypothetical protein BJX66DRAFT_201008 [Aspergillus keveii]|uniref:Uncharacterized protein n=1 Tax=Aspergillus keveii TaxID=714993 RepID=A0ABR4G5K3_9EURO
MPSIGSHKVLSTPPISSRSDELVGCRPTVRPSNVYCFIGIEKLLARKSSASRIQGMEAGHDHLGQGVALVRLFFSRRALRRKISVQEMKVFRDIFFDLKRHPSWGPLMVSKPRHTTRHEGHACWDEECWSSIVVNMLASLAGRDTHPSDCRQQLLRTLCQLLILISMTSNAGNRVP